MNYVFYEELLFVIQQFLQQHLSFLLLQKHSTLSIVTYLKIFLITCCIFSIYTDSQKTARARLHEQVLAELKSFQFS